MSEIIRGQQRWSVCHVLHVLFNCHPSVPCELQANCVIIMLLILDYYMNHVILLPVRDGDCSQRGIDDVLVLDGSVLRR